MTNDTVNFNSSLLKNFSYNCVQQEFEILKEQINSQISWKTNSLDIKSTIYQLSDEQISAFEQIEKYTDDISNIPQCHKILAIVSKEIIDRCENGVGFVILRGINAKDYSRSALKSIFYNFCNISGDIVKQNSNGETICEVTDFNKGKMKDSNVRAYLTNEALGFHSDSSDILALFCEKASSIGGDSLVVSAVTIHNQILEKYSEYLSLFYTGFFYDDRGQEAIGKLPAYRNPVFTFYENKLSCRYYLVNYIEPAYKKLGIDMSPFEKNALEIFNSIAEDPNNYISFRMEEGDMIFYSNNNVLHGRTAYDDLSHENSQRRRLYRVWLNPYKPRKLPEDFARYRFGYT